MVGCAGDPHTQTRPANGANRFVGHRAGCGAGNLPASPLAPTLLQTQPWRAPGVWEGSGFWVWSEPSAGAGGQRHLDNGVGGGGSVPSDHRLASHRGLKLPPTLWEGLWDLFPGPQSQNHLFVTAPLRKEGLTSPSGPPLSLNEVPRGNWRHILHPPPSLTSPLPRLWAPGRVSALLSGLPTHSILVTRQLPGNSQSQRPPGSAQPRSPHAGSPGSVLSLLQEQWGAGRGLGRAGWQPGRWVEVPPAC